MAYQNFKNNTTQKNNLFSRDMYSFIEESCDNIVDQIDIDYRKNIPNKAETFIQKVMKDTKGDLLVNEAVHNCMHRFLRFSKSKGFNKNLILGGFGLGKTEQMVIGYPLYRIAQNPDVLIKIVHVSDTEAVKRCRAIRDYIENDDDFHREAPHVRPTNIWGSERFTVKRKGSSPNHTVEAYSVLGTGIGGRANLLIFDDPQDLRTAVYEPTTRKKIEDTMKNIWITRLIPNDSEILVLMNKWNQQDWASVVQRNPTWGWMSVAVSGDFTHLIYQDSFGREKRLPLWSQFSKEDYLDRRSDLGQRDFDRGYRLIPFSDKDKTFSNFKSCCHWNTRKDSIIRDKKDWLFLGGIDFSSTKRPGTICAIVAIHKKTGVKVPVELSTITDTSQLIPIMLNYNKRWGTDIFMAENNGVQDAIIDLLRTALGQESFKRHNIKIEGFLTGANKASNTIGLPSINTECENNEWIFCFDFDEPQTDEGIHEDPWKRLYYEMVQHPHYDSTDMVMALWFCRELAKLLMQETGKEVNIY